MAKSLFKKGRTTSSSRYKPTIRAITGPHFNPLPSILSSNSISVDRSKSLTKHNLCSRVGLVLKGLWPKLKREDSTVCNPYR